MKRQLLFALIPGAACAGLFFLTSCGPRNPRSGAPPPSGPPQQSKSQPASGDSARSRPTASPVETALKGMLQSQAGDAIPKGTRLKSLQVENGTAKIDLSAEFGKVAEMGTTGESEAQKALRSTLAQFREIDRMLVTVEGKPLDSEHTDWTEPIPVRDEAAGAGSNP